MTPVMARANDQACRDGDRGDARRRAAAALHWRSEQLALPAVRSQGAMLAVMNEEKFRS